MSEHLTRRELKTDQFATTVGTTVEYISLHRRQATQITVAVIVAALAALGVYFWMEHNRNVRAEKLASALQITEATVGPLNQSTGLSFPDQKAKDAAVTKAMTDLATSFSGTREGAIGEYTLASMAVENNRNDEARKRFQVVIDNGSKEYASMARLALAQLDFAENRDSDGEKILRDLIANPTATVSKEQATITLARLIGRKRPAEARALLQPLLTAKGNVPQMAQVAMTELPAK